MNFDNLEMKQVIKVILKAVKPENFYLNLFNKCCLFLNCCFFPFENKCDNFLILLENGSSKSSSPSVFILYRYLAEMLIVKPKVQISNPKSIGQ